MFAKAPAALTRPSLLANRIIFRGTLYGGPKELSTRRPFLCLTENNHKSSSVLLLLGSSRRRSKHALSSFSSGAGSTAPLEDPSSSDGEQPGNAGTRLGKLLQTGISLIKARTGDVGTRLPLKIFLILLGFFFANALATILGQTGDWDVLVTGFLVATLEGLGWIVYGVPAKAGRPSWRPVRLGLVFLNYFKAGFMFGLFVDAFKVGS